MYTLVVRLPFLVELELKMMVFEEGGKLEYPDKNLSEQGR